MSMPLTSIPRPVTECGQSGPVSFSHPESRLLQCCLKRGAGGGPRGSSSCAHRPGSGREGAVPVDNGVRSEQKGGGGRPGRAGWCSPGSRESSSRPGLSLTCPGSAGKGRGLFAPRLRQLFLPLAARRSRGRGEWVGAGSRGGCRGNRRHVPRRAARPASRGRLRAARPSWVRAEFQGGRAEF